MRSSPRSIRLWLEVLREDKAARIELIKGKPGRPWRAPEPDRYEFSVGKYTRSGNLARTYNGIYLAPGEERFFETQLTLPVLLMKQPGMQWWWYLNRFWRDDEGLSDGDVQALVLQRERKKQAALERARAGTLGLEAPGETPEASKQRFLKQEEREWKQRLIEEHLAQVEGLNADVAMTNSALENLLAEALERDPSIDFDFENDDPETVASYFSLVLDNSPYPQGFPKEHRVAFVPESRQLVVEYELPTVSIVPPAKAYR